MLKIKSLIEFCPWNVACLGADHDLQDMACVLFVLPWMLELAVLQHFPPVTYRRGYTEFLCDVYTEYRQNTVGAGRGGKLRRSVCSEGASIA